MPKMPDVPLPAQMQAMQSPKDLAGGRARDRLRRRGMWSTVFTSPAGLSAAPMVTGGNGGLTGG